MAFSIRRTNGIEVLFKDTQVVLDAVRRSDSPVFISHAHGDHCGKLKLVDEAYSTQATFALAQVYCGKAKNHHFVEYGEKIVFGDVEVEAHNAGHILGSTQYEIISPLGNVVYTGDINFRDTLLIKRAEVVPCDILIIESTYGTPCYFPSKEYMYERIAKWTNYTIKTGKIPAFQTDALGNAQELIALLNRLTNIPVITHPKVSNYNNIYGEFGHKLEYLDQNCKEGKEVLDGKECTLILPKNVDLRGRPEFKAAFVSGWGSRFSGRRKAFCLSDHSDFYRLLEYVEEARPKVVFTCHGNRKSKMALAKKIQRTLHIPSSPLTKDMKIVTGESKIFASERLGECARELMTNVKPGFTYPRNWLISATCSSLRRFSKDEVEIGLSESVKTGKLHYIHETDSYELRRS